MYNTNIYARYKLSWKILEIAINNGKIVLDNSSDIRFIDEDKSVLILRTGDWFLNADYYVFKKGRSLDFSQITQGSIRDYKHYLTISYRKELEYHDRTNRMKYSLSKGIKISSSVSEYDMLDWAKNEITKEIL